MKPENFLECLEVIPAGTLGSKVNISAKEEGLKNPGASVGLRLCPLKMMSNHSHRVSGAWCDISERIFECLPKGTSCCDAGLCRVKTHIPNVSCRIVSLEEARFLLVQSVLVEKTSHYMGSLHRKLNERYNQGNFPRSILVP